MVIDPSDRNLWLVVARLERMSAEEWRKEFYPSSTHEGIMAQHLTAIETHVQRKPQGNIQVTVSFLAKKALDCRVDYYRLQRNGNRLYHLVEPGSFLGTDPQLRGED